MTGPYALTTPCKDCPFRTDIRAYLTPERVEEIEQSLVRAEFPCHKTTRVSDGDDDDCEGGSCYTPSGKEIHCAGALILLEKLKRPSQMMRISERLGMYDRRKLDMAAPVFDSFEEMSAAQGESLRRDRRTTRRRTRR